MELRKNQKKRNLKESIMETIEEICEFLILYFKFRNVANWGFTGYKCFKNLMIYITGLKDTATLRIIFDKLLKQGHFVKRKIGSNTDYQFIFSPK